MGARGDRGGVLLTLAGHAGCPAVDLEVAQDVRLADLRPHLAAATGRSELGGTDGRAGAPLAVGSVVLDDDQLTGEWPLLPGAVLRVGAGAPDRDRLALTAAWHLAVVGGPDSGALVPLDAAVVVGRRSDASPARATGLALDDPALSERHVEIAPARSGPRARDLGSRNGTRLVRARRSGPRRGTTVTLGRRGRGLRTGDRLLVGASVLEVRSADGASRPVSDAAQRVPAPTALSGAPSSWVAPAVGALVLAAATGNRMLLALAVVGPATALATSAVARRPRRRATRFRGGRAPGTTSSHRADLVLPVAVDLRVQALAACGDHDPDPSAPVDARGPEHGASVRARRTRGHPAPGGSLDRVTDDGRLAVVGPRATALAVVRLLVCAELGRGIATAGGGDRADAPDTSPVSTVRVVSRRSDIGPWRWTRWLAPRDHRAADLLVVDGAGDGPLHGSGVGLADGRTPSGAAAVGGRGVRGAACIVVLEARSSRVPPWCRTVLTVAPDGRTVRVTRPGTPPVTVPLSGVSDAWADRQARLLHGAGAPERRTPAGESTPRAAEVRGAVTAGRGAGSRRDAVARAADGAGAIDLPGVVALADLPGIPPPDAARIAGVWARRSHTGPDGRPAAGGLPAVIGRGAGGAPLVLDLVHDGPHGLVAGTTGAGKSGLLQTWLLSLALTRSPADLAVLLVDHKGGASFGLCAGLPHVVAQVTDLDAALAARALTSLRAELRRREELLARWTAPDLDTLRRLAPDAAPPRLLVVVDEFRALVDDLPGFVPGLLRVAAQGRSLGVHLLLATQRPGGAVTGDLRANLAVRVALRVTDPADSLDVVDLPDAAAIPGHLVGRAVLRRGGGAPEPLQVAHADAPAARGHRLARRVDDRAAGNRRWSVDAGGRARRPAAEPAAATGEPGMDATPTAAWVRAACAAALAAGIPRPPAPWLPPLPERLTLDELSTGEGGAGTSAARSRIGEARLGGLPLALADHPARQRRSVVEWDPWSGPLLVVGGALSGRSTALDTLASAALARGWHVHRVSGADAARPGDGCDPWAGAGHRRGSDPQHGQDPTGAVDLWGTTVTTDDPRRLARLVTLLAGGARDVRPVARPGEAGEAGDAPVLPPVLLLVDGLEAVLTALGAVARGRAAEVLLDVLRDGRRGGVAVAATASPGLAPSAGRLFTDRLVLRLGDPLAEATAGVPTALAGTVRGPGRGVWLPGARRSADTSDAAALCQVAVATADGSGRAASPPPAAAMRLRAVPRHVTVADLRLATADGPRPGPPASRPAAVPIGLGGDDAGPVALGLDHGALVVGPAGSGRSTALAAVARALLDRGTVVAIVAREGPLRDVGATRAPGLTCGHAPAAVTALLDRLPRESGGGPVVLLVDDVDALDQRAPDLGHRLAALAAVADDLPATRTVVVASAQTAAAVVAFRGLLGGLRATRRGLVLGAAEPGSSEVFGVDLAWDLDPTRPHAPGRGVVVDGRHTQPVQVADGAAP